MELPESGERQHCREKSAAEAALAGKCRTRQEPGDGVDRQTGEVSVLFQFFRLGNSWGGSLCFGGGGRVWFFISYPALWAESLPAPGAHVPALLRCPSGSRSCGCLLSESPAPFPAFSAQDLGRRASAAGLAVSPRGFPGSRLEGAQLRQRLLVGGTAGKRLILWQGLGS